MRRTEMACGPVRRPLLTPRARKPGSPSGVREERCELAFRQRLVSPSKLDWNVVEPARREAAIEMPQAGNDHPGDRDFDVGPRLIEDEEIELVSSGDTHAGLHLFA